MKKLFTVLAVLLVNSVVFAIPPPVPLKMSYQAVIRNSSNALVTNKQVGMKINILQTSATGTVVYSETQTPTTNANGLINIAIGTGVVVSGTFSYIDWSAGPYFIKTEIDPTGGTAYSITVVSELLSVPYALYAKNVELIPDNSVTSAKIVDGTITSADLRDNAVTVAKISSSGASNNQVLTNSGSDVIWGYGTGAVIKYTVLSPGCHTVASFTSTAYSKIGDLGSFVKADASSRMEITFNGRIYAEIMTGWGAVFQLRVDNVATTVGRAQADLISEQKGYAGEWVSIEGIFTGLTTGTHTISMWIKGLLDDGKNGGIDPGCLSDNHMIAREIK